LSLPDAVFGIEPNEHVVYLAVKTILSWQKKWYSQNIKKNLSYQDLLEKLHKQKGTGGSRKGSIKNPLFRGGARIFGPRPRFLRF
jgi:large subunit ribosomal protein L4